MRCSWIGLTKTQNFASMGNPSIVILEYILEYKCSFFAKMSGMYLLGYLYSNPMLPLLLQLPEKRSQTLPVGNFGILSVVCDL